MPGTNDLAISVERMRKEATAAPKYYPNPEEAKLIGTITRHYRDKDVTKRAYEKTWFINGAFLRGLQYIVFNDYTRTFEQPFKVPAHRIRLVVNYVLSYWRRTKAKLTANKPGFYVRPASTDQTDVARARLDEKVLDSELDRMSWPIKFKKDVGEMLQCGSGLLFIGWDPFAGDPLFQTQPKTDWMGQTETHPETGEPMTEQTPLLDDYGRHLHTGENVLEVVSPFEIQVDSQSTGTDDARWMMRNKVRSLEWIRENYPKMGKYVNSEAVYVTDFYQKRMRQIVGMFGYTVEAQEGESDQENPKDTSVVHEYWEKPTTKYPKGRHVVVASDVLLHDGENPYDHGQFPYVKMDEITIPDRFWGMSIIEQMLPLQKNYNRARSQEIENRTLVGRPKWMVPRTSKVRQSAFDSEPGEKIDYNPGPRGEKPELVMPTSISQASMQEIAHTLSDMQEVCASHEVSRGILPSANIPAEGIQMLQQSDDTSLGDTVSNIDNCLVELGKLILSNCAQFWNEERMVRATGEGQRLEAQSVTGQDLQGTNRHADYFDVRVIAGSTLVKDPEKQREKVAQYMQMGLLMPGRDNDKIVKMLDIGDTQDFFADLRLDEQWAQRENELMAASDFVVPRDFENHHAHVAIHDRFRKSEKYRQLAPPVQALFDHHVEMHQMLELQNAQKQAQMQLAIQSVATSGPAGEGEPEGGEGGGAAGAGGPPGKGSPKPPSSKGAA